MNKYLILSIKIIISFSLFYLVVNQIDISTIQNYMLSANFYLIGFTYILTLFAVVLSSYKLKILMEKGKLSDYTKLNFIGIFFSLFMPGTIGGDVVRIAYLKKWGVNLHTATSRIFMDRFTGLMAILLLFLLGVVAIIINSNINLAELFVDLKFKIELWQVFTLIFIFALIATFGFMLPVLRKFLLKTLKDIVYIFSVKKILAKTMIIAIFFQFLSPVMFFLMLLALDSEANISFFYILMIIPIMNLILMLPISIQGIGVREFLYVQLIPQIVPEMLVAASFFSYIIRLLYGMLGIYFINHSPVNE